MPKASAENGKKGGRPSAQERAEKIVRDHDLLCVGYTAPDQPWCSTLLDDAPLCAACQQLADAIATAIKPPRASTEGER